MRVLICGSTTWTDEEPIYWRLLDLKFRLVARGDVLTVIEGEAPGADTLARHAAERLALPVLPFPANWKLQHRAAGPIRNRQMLVEGRPQLVWAFYSGDEPDRGTANMLKLARAAGLPVHEFDHEGERDG